jgi:hypothetical protein
MDCTRKLLFYKSQDETAGFGTYWWHREKVKASKTDFRSNMWLWNTHRSMSPPSKYAANDNFQQPIIRLNEHLAYHIMLMHHVVTTLLIKPPIILTNRSQNTLEACLQYFLSLYVTGRLRNLPSNLCANVYTLLVYLFICVTCTCCGVFAITVHVVDMKNTFFVLSV